MSVLYKNRNWLYQKYWNEKLSAPIIAKLCKVDPATTWRWLIKYNIKRRSRSEALVLVHFKNPKRIKGKNNPMWGKRGTDTSNWRGGKRKHKDGYIEIWLPTHPNAHPNGYVFESHLVAEKALGRYLTKNEIVHHINGIKDDNRNSNLLICTESYHQWLHNKMRRLNVLIT